MRVKLMVSEGMVDEISSKSKLITHERYEAYVNVFGKGNFGIVSVADVKKEIERGEPSLNYLLFPNLNIQITNETGVDSELFLASGLNLQPDIPPKREDLELILNFLDQKRFEGKISYLVNSKEATLYEDKLLFVELYDKGLPVPETYHFSTLKEFEKFISETSKSLVVKHRFGCGGGYNFLINKENINQIRNLRNMDINDFIVQPELPIKSETRMILFRDQLLGARIIIDRTRPWEKKGVVKRDHIVKKHKPTKQELEIALNVFGYVGADVGCIDSIHLDDGRDLVLEYNGVGTGYGYAKGAYDLNNTVFNKLKETFL